MKKLDITKGKVTAHNQNGAIGHCVVAQVFDELGCALAYFEPTKDEEESSSNAQLYADAHNQYNKLPILPSQLANDRERLIEFVKNVAHCDFDSVDKILYAQELLTYLNQ